MIDLEKFKIVWDKNRKMLIRRLCFSGLDLQLAEEICQDAFIKYYEAIENGEEIVNPGGWLNTVVMNKSKDQFRGGERNYEIRDQDEYIDSFAAELDLGEHVYIQECVNKKIEIFSRKFPERAVVIKSQLDDCSILEISKFINRTEQATRQFIYESKKILMPFLVECKELVG